jgi:pyrroloquinoline-quinone synthase
MTTTLDIDSFLEDLERELRETHASLLDADFLAAVEAGTVSRAGIEAWARMFYAATRNGRFGLGTYYSNCPPDDRELTRELAENLYEEETGRISGVGKCHMDVFFDFLAAFGITPEEAFTLELPGGNPLPQGRAIPADDFYVELSVYGLSVEVPNAEYCVRIAKGLKENYGFTDADVTWFTMHAELDADHGEEFQSHVAKAATAPRGLERVHDQTLAMSDSVRKVWDGFGVWRDK